MNIYFTSYGVDIRYSNYMDSYDDIINVLKDKKVAIIPNAKLYSEDRTNSKVAKEELNKNNIDADIIDIDSSELNFKNYDALYLSGGEPKNLMDSIISANLFNDIKNFIDNGGIVIGQSAGAMIFCKNYYDTTTKKLLIMNNGYDYSKKMIVPHYDNLPKELKEQMKPDLLKINDNDRLIKLKEKNFLMNENKLTIYIDKPIEDVFEYSLESDNVPKWITSIEKEIPSERPVKIGTRLRNIGVNSDSWNEYEIVEFLPPKTFTLKKLNDDYFVKYTCTKNGSGTDFEYYEWAENKNLDDIMEIDALELLKEQIEEAGE